MTAAAPPRTPEAQRHTPARLQIPSIGLDAAVESLGVTQDQSGSALAMAVPTRPDEVGWYSPGPAPGDAAGDVVMDGHLDWTNGPAVFWRLGQLKIHDGITVVADDGTVTRWKVEQVADWPPDAHPPGLFDRSGPRMLSLITCTGRFDGAHYDRRRVVTASAA